MSQQYYYNNAQYTTPTSYAGQSANACYAVNAQPMHTGYTLAKSATVGSGTTYNVSSNPMSSAHRSQAPVTYTYPSNATVGVIQGQQTTLVTPTISVGKLGSAGPSFVIANGPSSAQPNLSGNNAYTVTTSYFQPISGQTHVQHQNMAQAVAVAQQANYRAAMNVANSSRGRRNVFDARFQNFRKNVPAKPRSSIDSQVFYCDVCKIICAGPQTYKEHLDGKNHKKKASGNIIPLSSNQRQLRCELCDITCTGADAYQAHIIGSKHKKTFNLHQLLGKPIPNCNPLVPVNSNDQNGTTNIADGADASTLKSGGIDMAVADKALLQSTDMDKETGDLNSLQERSVIPIGSEYIETTTNENGKVIQFNCKLCSCTFNDPHAREMHLKGKRHRIQYKRKVDPSLVVENKSIRSRNSKIEEEIMRQKQQREEFWRRRDMQMRMQEMQRLEYANIPYMGGHGIRSFETLDDKHVLAKHDSICPTEEENKTVQSVVVACEKALGMISQVLIEEVPEIKDDSVTITSTGETKEDDKPPVIKTDSQKNVPVKLLSGAMRVGPLAKSVLLKGELVVSLVLLCSKWPTMTLMAKVVEKLPEKLKELLVGEDIDVSLSEEYQCILVSRTKAPEMHCYIHFTSSVIREESALGVPAVQPDDGLDRKRCLDALASLRHTKWFQAKVNGFPCLSLIRLLRDLCQRVPAWTSLSSWALELLAEKVMSSGPMKLSPGAALRRFFECVASGILLPGGPGLRDPCEKEITDASGLLSDQAREDITMSAQHALRLIAFRQIHTVLAMEPVAGGDKIHGVKTESVTTNGRKRRHSGDDLTEVVTPVATESSTGLKKEKKESEGESVSEVAAQ